MVAEGKGEGPRAEDVGMLEVRGSAELLGEAEDGSQASSHGRRVNTPPVRPSF
jgi:hypothetical protein